MTQTNNSAPIIAFQGFEGAYSDMACRAVYPQAQTLPCHTFDKAFAAVKDGKADLAMIPVDNTLAGRVADVHRLLPQSGLHIIGEYFLPICHALMGIKGASLDDIETVHSHVHALPQCRDIIKELSLKEKVHADTAGAAQAVAHMAQKSEGAIASPLAAEIYGLDILKENVQDADHNTTRFLILSRADAVPAYEENHTYLTSFLFEVRNIPAALYKALGGFATNGVNMVKLESYVDEQFQAALFFAEVMAHPEERGLKFALEELDFFAKKVMVLGTYPAHAFRTQ